MTDLEEYLSKLTPEQMIQHNRIRDIVANIVPEYEEVISYGVPTFKYKGKYLIYFAAYADHMSVHPSPSETRRKELQESGYKLGKGTIQFTAEKPVPEEILTEMVLDRYSILSK